MTAAALFGAGGWLLRTLLQPLQCAIAYRANLMMTGLLLLGAVVHGWGRHCVFPRGLLKQAG